MVMLPLSCYRRSISAAQPQQRVFGRHQLAPRLVDALLLTLHEPPVRRDGLVDPVGRLRELVVDLPGEPLAEPPPQLVDAGAGNPACAWRRLRGMR